MTFVQVLQEEAERQMRSGAPMRRQRGQPRVFGKWCKGCGLCVAFCPQQVYEMREDGHPIVAHAERCVACQWCEIHCPDFAILVQPYDPDAPEVAK
ncbi:MAG: 4Fe-4S binding protein [Anaerolineae bacterium]|nr:4Fe-4S binding protein [Anaerolineae bacterium]